MSTAIKVENLSKIYRLGEIGTGSISRDLERWYKTKLLGKEDPFLKIGESNDRSKKGASDIVYSLKDINFEIEQGDAVGIIGRNGAGKSTLLKILSRVTTPTTGKVNIKGRVASLLEVGTGFHPELTGRENIYLNGAILGMRKKEIDRKLEEIIDFSGVERYIDTPVKRYSSGMYVRLAFAVAAHLESEILIVDEVLAVGDAEFQKKCLGKMGEVSKGEGRTVLFVSHNMAAVENFCNKGLLLNDGNSESFNEMKQIIADYANYNLNVVNNFYIEIEDLEITNFKIGNNFKLALGEDLILEFELKNNSNNILRPFYNFEIKNNLGQFITCAGNEFNDFELVIPANSKRKISTVIKECYLQPGDYYINFYFSESNLSNNIYLKDIITFEILEKDIFGTGRIPKSLVHGLLISNPIITIDE